MSTGRGKYATRAMLELSLSYDKGPILIHQITERQRIPVKFLEQILLALKSTGFVRSRKGPGGGYYLTKSPSCITVEAILRSVDGPIALVRCASLTRHQECGCPDPTTYGLRQVWQEAREALAGVLDRTTFRDICSKHLSGAAEHGGFDYSI